MLLLDEPLGALDLKLRREMQIELKQLQRDVGITFVFVTHDQEEALTMSDRIAVFNDGRIEQVATPAELYEAPASSFVAGFVGTSNLLTGETARVVLGRERHVLDPAREDPPRRRRRGGRPARAGPPASSRRSSTSARSTTTSSRLDEGGTLTVLRQNLHGTADQQVGAEGERVDARAGPTSTSSTLDPRPPPRDPTRRNT